MNARRAILGFVVCGTLLSHLYPADARGVVAVCQGGGGIVTVDTAHSAFAGLIETGGRPAMIAQSPHDTRFYVTDPDGARILALREGRVEAKLPFAGQPFGIAAGSQDLYVTDWSGGSLVKLDRASGRRLAAVAVGKSPAAVVLDDKGHAFVADREGDAIAVVDVATMRGIARIRVGEAPFALALSPDTRWLYVANVRGNDVSIIDTGRLVAVARIPVGPMPYGVAVTSDGSTLLVTVQHAAAVRFVDLQTRSVVGSVRVGQYPEGVICDGDRAYVANWGSDDVSIIDIATRREAGRVKVGAGPRSLALAVSPWGKNAKRNPPKRTSRLPDLHASSWWVWPGPR